MSMLAEPRRKQRINVDPRNKTWAEDDSAFGKRMLKNLGWKEGSGLGADLQGKIQPVKPKVNPDSRGLGSTHSSEDNWLAHQDDFEALLQQLNSRKVKPQSDNLNKEDLPKPDGKSLEVLSKKSRARIHYQKFTRGKDVSKYSSEDMSSILGVPKRQKRKRRSSKTVPAETDESQLPPPVDTEISQTVPVKTSSLSVSEYFAQKMKEKLQTKNSTVVSETEPEADIDDSSQHLEIGFVPFVSVQQEMEDCAPKPKKTKKKKRKHEEAED